MNVGKLTYYKDYKCNIGIAKTRLPDSARLVAVTFIVFLSAVFTTDVRAQAADTVAVSACARARIDFKVNLTDFDGSYHGNDSGLERLLAEIDSMVLNPHMRVERITVVGTASPEGPYRNNVRLATGRAEAFISILRDRYSFPDSIWHVSTIPEDWEGMRLMLMEDPSIPYAGVVLTFLDATGQLSPETREHRLKRLDGGRPYSSMRGNVLPYLRRASVIVDYGSILPGRGRSFTVIPPCLPATRPTLALDGIRMPVTRQPAPTVSRQRFLAVRTNLLCDAALCANLGFEVELWPRWSLDVPVWYSPWDISSRWRIRLLATQPEVRRWLREAGAGHYFGVHATVAGFNISTGGDFRYQDPNHAAFGMGIGYGYAFHLDKARHWSLEAQIGAGYINYKWVKYHNTGRNGAEVSRSGGTYWGVTRAGLTLSYKFYADRKGRRWMRW